MIKRDELLLRSLEQTNLLAPESRGDDSESKVRITDRRVAQLLLILHEVDVTVAGLENFSEQQLGDVVGAAIQACGFTDPIEARSALASILKLIEAPPPFRDGS